MTEYRKLSTLDYAQIYFRKSPFIIGEALVIGGILLISNSEFLGIIGVLGGFYFVYLKVEEVVFSKKAIEHGEMATAHLVSITNTNLEHNDRVVKIYVFEYEGNDKKHHFSKKSAYARFMEKQKTYIVFYPVDKPNRAFVPAFYGINRFDNS